MILLALLALVALVLIARARPDGRTLPRPRAAGRVIARATAIRPLAPRPPAPRPAAPPTPRPEPLGPPTAGGALPRSAHGFEFGRAYTRQAIHAAIGGGLQDYLPHVGGRVIAGCFNLRLNPHAPFVVLPGFGPAIQRWAYVFAAQEEPVPCFLRRDGNVWEYVGDYRVRSLSEDEGEVAEWSALAGREGGVSMVLHLEAAGADAAEP